MNFFCSKDCPDLCGLNISETDGKLTFSGVANEWDKAGFVCSKFRIFAEREIGNGLKSWQITDGNKTEYPNAESSVEALASYLENFRDKKILYMRGSGSLAYNMTYWDILFSSFENCWGVSGGPCDDTGGDAHEADFGTLVNPDIMNLEDADTIILYGKNAAVCSQHLYAYLKDLKKRGKKLIYLDPVKTKTAELADKYIMINPCCDGLLACALLVELGFEDRFAIEELLNISGVSQDDFMHIAESIRNGRTAHIQGFGIQRQKNGMNAFQWINRLAVKTDATDLLYFGHGSKRKWSKPEINFKDYVHVDKLAETLARGDFDLYVNIAANPAMTFPDTKMWKAGLTMTPSLIVDTNDTETSAYADFFFKVGGMFAQTDFMGSYFFPHDLHREAYTDELSDMKAAKLTGEKLGINIEIKDISEVEEKPQKERIYQTEELELTMPEKSDRLQFFTASHHAYLNSQITSGMEEGLQTVYINTADAWKNGIKNGDDIIVSNETGSFTAEAVVTDDIAKGVIMCWKNIPMKEGYLNNAVPCEMTDSGNGLVYYTVFVDITKA